MKTTRSYLLTMVLLFAFVVTKGQHRYVEVGGTADFLHAGDTIIFRLYRHPNTDQEPGLVTEQIQKATNKRFSFRVPCGDFPHYFNVRFKNHSGKGLYKFFAVPGHSLQLHFNSQGFDADGSGIIAKVQSEVIKAMQVPANPEEDEADARALIRNRNAVTFAQLRVLERYRAKLPLDFYQFMKADLLAINISGKYRDVEITSRRYADSASNPYLEQFMHCPDSIRTMLDDFARNYPGCRYSESYLYAIQKIFRVDSCIAMKKKYDIRKCYDYLKANYQGQLREELISYLILTLNDYPGELTFCISDALTIVRDEDYRTLLKTIAETRVDGAKAYNFRLADQKGEIHQLSDFRNKVVFIDFWFTGCGFCRVVAPYIRKLEERFKGQNVEFISISSDESKSQWEKSVAGGQYVAPENHNFFTAGQGSYHPALTKFRIREFPAFILVDRNGLIRNVPIDPREDDGRSIEAQIRSLL